MTARFDDLNAWLKQKLHVTHFNIQPASSDASFRRYYRVTYGDNQTLIAMDAPPQTEDSGRYIAVAQQLHNIGLNVPQILEADLERGFLLITDLGNRTYLDELTADTADRLYGDAIKALLILQAKGPRAGGLLPSYDQALLERELSLFKDWFLQQHLAIELDEEQQETLEQVDALLVHSALEQPTVTVHRDYHSRNLMIIEKNNPGILDFQDAVVGPVTYDLVSLLRDCYIAWPREQVEQWVNAYYQQLVSTGLLTVVGKDQFLFWFDLMGMQRHMKAIGIFARLNIRDGKPGYLQDIPRTLNYVQEVSARYPELKDFNKFCQQLNKNI